MGARDRRRMRARWFRRHPQPGWAKADQRIWQYLFMGAGAREWLGFYHRAMCGSGGLGAVPRRAWDDLCDSVIPQVVPVETDQVDPPDRRLLSTEPLPLEPLVPLWPLWPTAPPALAVGSGMSTVAVPS